MKYSADWSCYSLYLQSHKSLEKMVHFVELKTTKLLDIFVLRQ